MGKLATESDIAGKADTAIVQTKQDVIDKETKRLRASGDFTSAPILLGDDWQYIEFSIDIGNSLDTNTFDEINGNKQVELAQNSPVIITHNEFDANYVLRADLQLFVKSTCMLEYQMNIPRPEAEGGEVAYPIPELSENAKGTIYLDGVDRYGMVHIRLPEDYYSVAAFRQYGVKLGLRVDSQFKGTDNSKSKNIVGNITGLLAGSKEIKPFKNYYIRPENKPKLHRANLLMRQI